jgi:hypothetical protein
MMWYLLNLLNLLMRCNMIRERIDLWIDVTGKGGYDNNNNNTFKMVDGCFLHFSCTALNLVAVVVNGQHR